jgi:hypothetical protein
MQGRLRLRLSRSATDPDGVSYFDVPVVVDVSQVAEFVHASIDARSGGAEAKDAHFILYRDVSKVDGVSNTE